MERDPKQPILGRCALWINDLDLAKSYWILLLTNYGIYDPENEYIKEILERSEESTSLIPNPFEPLNKSQTQVTLDFFIWLYDEDQDLCFRILKHVYDDFKNEDDVPDPYKYIDELENLGESENFPELDLDEIVPATPRVFDSGDELNFYYQAKDRISQADERVFIIDAYADEEAIWYLKETSEDVEKRILTQGKKDKLSNAAKKFVSSSDHRVEIRRNGNCHDRLIFIDEKCFAVGDSLHAAGSKPMYAVEFNATEKFCQPWEQMWAESEKYAVFED